MADPRKAVAVLSPLRAVGTRTEEDHLILVQRLSHLATVKGNAAPFASHLFYTIFLRDSVEEERRAGMDAALAWLVRADEVWVWDVWGISGGMQAEIAFLLDWNYAAPAAGLRPIPIRYASKGEIPCWDGLREAP